MKIYCKSSGAQLDKYKGWNQVNGQVLEVVDESPLAFEHTLKESHVVYYNRCLEDGWLYIRGTEIVGSGNDEQLVERELYIEVTGLSEELVTLIFKKYLMYSTMFWTYYKKLFASIETSESPVFNIMVLSDSPIQLPDYNIRKEYELPAVINSQNKKALELLAAGLEGINDVEIITSDSIDGVLDLEASIFITDNHSDLDKEIKRFYKLKRKSRILKSLALTFSIITTLVVAVKVFIEAKKNKEE